MRNFINIVESAHLVPYVGDGLIYHGTDVIALALIMASKRLWSSIDTDDGTSFTTNEMMAWDFADRSSDILSNNRGFDGSTLKGAVMVFDTAVLKKDGKKLVHYVDPTTFGDGDGDEDEVRVYGGINDLDALVGIKYYQREVEYLITMVDDFDPTDYNIPRLKQALENLLRQSHSIVTEARRNPEVNKKISAFDALSKYAGKPNLYVSFTDDVGVISHFPTRLDGYKAGMSGAKASGDMHNVSGSKLGINPMSDYPTPVGIYAYPLQYVLDQNMDVPFGSERPYIQVFEAVNPTRILNVAVGRNAAKLFRELHAQATAQVEAHADFEEMEVENTDKMLGHLLGSLWRKQPYDGLLDYNPSTGRGKGIIFEDEPTQAVFFRKSAIRLVETIHNISPSNEDER